MRFPAVVTVAALCLSTHAALAHVFWLKPTTFRPEAGTLVKVQFRVGDNLPGDTLPRDEERIARFISSGPSGEAPLVGRDGGDPAGIARFLQPGTVVVAYQSNPAFVRLEAEKFENYLRLEGLDGIIHARAEAGQSQAPAREHYARCAKTVLSVGGRASPGFDRAVGLPLELIPESDPAALRPGKTIAFRLVRDGAPAAGTLVKLMNTESPESTASGRTDASGRVTLAVSRAGTWVANAVEMSVSTSPDADWESLWASLSFEVSAGEDEAK